MGYLIFVSFSKLTVVRRLAGPPDPRQVVCGGRHSQFDRCLRQPATSESPHSSLLVQHSEYRFYDRFSPLVNSSSCRVAQFPSHSPMRRITGSLPQPSASIQPSRQVRVRHIGVYLPLLQSLQILQREEASVAAGSLQFLSALLFHPIHHRQQRLVIVGVLRHLLRHNQMILANRQRRRIAQREPAPLPQKTAVGIGPREFLQPRFAQPLEPLGNLCELLFQPRDPCATHGAARAFVRIFRIAVLLPAANVPPDARSRVPQRLLGVDPVPRRVRRDARRIDRHVSQLAQLRLAGQFHHLREHIIQRSRLSPAKVVQRPVVRRGPRRQIAKRQILAKALLQPPRTRHPQRVGIQPNRYQHLRSIGRPAFFSILAPEHFHVQFRHDPANQKAQVIRSQYILHARRQQIRLLRVVIQKFRHRISSLMQYKRRVKASSHTDSSAPEARVSTTSAARPRAHLPKIRREQGSRPVQKRPPRSCRLIPRRAVCAAGDSPRPQLCGRPNPPAYTPTRAPQRSGGLRRRYRLEVAATCRRRPLVQRISPAPRAFRLSQNPRFQFLPAPQLPAPPLHPLLTV